MPSFMYEAIDTAGKIVKAKIEADTEDAVKAELRKQNLTVISVTTASALNKDLNIDISFKPSIRDLSVFCRQFVSMFRSGVNMTDSLTMLSESTENKKLRETLNDVRLSVERGESLSMSFAEHPKIFTDLMVNMTAAGEASGSLDIAFDRMATQLERSHKTKSIVKKALVYPVVVLIVMLVVVVVMLVKVIPAYAEMFQDLDTDLPKITQIVQGISNFLIHYWFILVPVLVAIIIGIAVFNKTDTGKHFTGKIALTIPAIKNLVVKSSAAQMARTLSTLVAAGIPLVEAVDISASIMGNIYFKEALQHAKDEIMIGQPLSRPLQESGIFPPMCYHMVRIGEETGNTEEMLDKTADYYEEEVEMAVQTMMAAMEPVIIIVLALVVGTIIWACLAPMMAMYTGLDNL